MQIVSRTRCRTSAQNDLKDVNVVDTGGSWPDATSLSMTLANIFVTAWSTQIPSWLSYSRRVLSNEAAHIGVLCWKPISFAKSWWSAPSLFLLFTIVIEKPWRYASDHWKVYDHLQSVLWCGNQWSVGIRGLGFATARLPSPTQWWDFFCHSVWKVALLELFDANTAPEYHAQPRQQLSIEP